MLNKKYKWVREGLPIMAQQRNKLTTDGNHADHIQSYPIIFDQIRSIPSIFPFDWLNSIHICHNHPSMILPHHLNNLKKWEATTAHLTPNNSASKTGRSLNAPNSPKPGNTAATPPSNYNSTTSSPPHRKTTNTRRIFLH